jgi:hypothetical protein
VAAGCEPSTPAPEAPAGQPHGAAIAVEHNPLRNAYFGDLHVHTNYSMDANLYGSQATPDDAYRFARGDTLEHPVGYEMKLASGPLDFYAVTDHAVLLGHVRAMSDPSERVYEHELAAIVRAAQSLDERRAALGLLGGSRRDGSWREFFDPALLRSAWQEIAEAAQRHYEPGVFTTFIGYEYTSGPERQNLHRNVIFRGTQIPAAPFSTLDSLNPEDLWAWMDDLRAEGIESLAIPHNSNESNGLMFRRTSFEGDPLDAAYAEQRMRNEPVVEVTQIKGTSETHPMLSPTDEWAGFELYPYRSGANAPKMASDPPGSYVRDAYLRGLQMEEAEGFNPFRFGLIGSSDTHNGASQPEESSFSSKIGFADGTPEIRGSIPRADEEGYVELRLALWGASGLAAVWAEQNTREAIYDAMRRKETFATSGPRIRIRFFAGYGLPETLAEGEEALERAYAGGVPMGADLDPRQGNAPRFVAQAMRDPSSAPLERLQIVKGWLENGVTHERVFDIACSGGAVPDPDSWRCPSNGASVDLSDCSVSEDVGAAVLDSGWSDPAFEPSQIAFYYVRALENPTCRWSTWDALRAGVQPREGLPQTIQERAWSSPIWITPTPAE